MSQLLDLIIAALLVFSRLTTVRSDTDACTLQDSCSCKLQDGRELSFQSLAKTDGQAAFTASDPQFGYSFYFNPCLQVKNGNCRADGPVAICQTDSSGLGISYTCGTQPTARFVYRDNDNSSIYLRFEGGTEGRKSYIKLVCNPNATSSTFSYIKEDPLITYNFELSSPCACPDQKGCDVAPPLTCEMEDECSCKMSDGSGSINLRSLNNATNPLQVRLFRSTIYYNPCQGFTVKSLASNNPCVDVSVCKSLNPGSLSQQNLNIGDYPGEFETGTNNTVFLTYKSKEGSSSRVQLICDRSARERPVLTYLGTSGSTFNFALRSVCACSGECVSPPRQCKAVNSCSCRYGDGSGLVSLRNLDNPYAPLKTVDSDDFGTISTYYYNPCSGIKLGGVCQDVSACQQVNATDFSQFRLGKVAPTSFTVENEQLTLKYSGGDGDRRFQVTLICDPNAVVPQFGNVTEAPLKSYKFDLRSRCACPNTCPNE